jgi:hypothetical protein
MLLVEGAHNFNNATTSLLITKQQTNTAFDAKIIKGARFESQQQSVRPFLAVLIADSRK